jgi:hypothetical protein
MRMREYPEWLVLPIYSTYPDDVLKIEYIVLPKLHAKYPTKQALLQMTSFYKIIPHSSSVISMIKNTFSLLEQSRESKIIQHIFQNTVTVQGTKSHIPRDSLEAQREYCAIKQEFQKRYNIHLAFLGGLT